MYWVGVQSFRVAMSHRRWAFLFVFSIYFRLTSSSCSWNGLKFPFLVTPCVA